jgi:hypothetical protein
LVDAEVDADVEMGRKPVDRDKRKGSDDDDEADALLDEKPDLDDALSQGIPPVGKGSF